MAVDCGNLVDALKGRVNPPGVDLYPNSTDDDWIIRLTDAFWDARLKGVTALSNFEENAAARGGPSAFGEGIITPIAAVEGYDDPNGWSSTEDMARETQQIIVLFAAWRITLAKMQEVKTKFKSKAGPVEYERQQSATLLKAVLDALKAEIDELSDSLTGGTGGDAVFDALINREWAMYDSEITWVR